MGSPHWFADSRSVESPEPKPAISGLSQVVWRERGKLVRINERSSFDRLRKFVELGIIVQIENLHQVAPPNVPMPGEPPQPAHSVLAAGHSGLDHRTTVGALG